MTGDKAKDAQNISMTELAKQKVTFGDITAADGKAITPVITVTCPEWPGENLQAQADGATHFRQELIIMSSPVPGINLSKEALP